MGKGLIPFCWAFVITRMIDLVVIIVVTLTQVGRVGIAFNLTKIKMILFSSLPIGAFYMTLYAYNYTDTVMLANWSGPQEIGWYNAAYRIYEGFFIIPTLLGTVFLPRLSRYHAENGENFPVLLSAGIKSTTVLAGFIMINGLLFSDKLILLLFGNEYTPSTTALNILLLGIIPVFCTTFMQILLIAMREQKNLLRLSLSGLILNVALNFWFIPHYSFIGAAKATLISEFFVFSGYVFFLYKFIVGFKAKEVFGKMLLIIALLMIPVFFVHSFPFILRIALCNILLVCGIYVFNVFTPAERKMILH
jgi:O-antigen/teichoic acid export membrane protein